MFGLEDQKKSKGSSKGKAPVDFTYELEVELSQPGHYAAMKRKVEERIALIKNTLRSGESKGEFNKYGLLLHGYTSLLKVINRIKGVK